MNLDRLPPFHRVLLAIPACVGLLAAGCGDDGGGRESTAGITYGGITTAPGLTWPGTSGDSDSASSTGADAGTSTDAEASAGANTGPAGDTGAEPEEAPGGAEPDEAGPKFDLGSESDSVDPGSQESKPCVKIDLLFVVDNSKSMKQEQENLVASFPTFVTEIQQELAEAESLHIGVISTDKYKFNEPACAKTLGALVTETGGEGASGAVCGPYASGRRFMNEMDDLPSRFTCAAQVGIGGSGDEMPIDAALAAIGPVLNAPGACNEGFVRDDALLVLVLITDEEDSDSSGTPQQWFNAFTALKGGVETNVVVLSLIGPKNPACKEAAEIGEKLTEFTEMFTYGSVGQVCAENYQQFFHDAIAGIAEACDHFTPPG